MIGFESFGLTNYIRTNTDTNAFIRVLQIPKIKWTFNKLFNHKPLSYENLTADCPYAVHDPDVLGSNSK
jgi:hypothetical protein